MSLASWIRLALSRTGALRSPRRPGEEVPPIRGRYHPSIEHLEARQLLSGTSVVPPGDLHDPLVALVADAEFVQSQGRLTRADVIHLFKVVDGTDQVTINNGKVSFARATPNPVATLTASELADLRALVQDASLWGLTPDAANLADKVVNSDHANKSYLPAGQSELTPGSKDSLMQVLVGNWFYGDDLPAISVAGATYQKAHGTLFGEDGPRASDIAQGEVGDCWFLSMLAETALQSPQTVESMFIDNGDGTYTVRFYNNSVADYVTVNSKLPANCGGDFVYANHNFGGHTDKVSSSTNVLWVALAEKAYAQLAGEGWSINASSKDAYAALNGSQTSRAAGMQITGWQSSQWIWTSSLTTSVLTQIASDFAEGGLVTFCLHGDHYYYMTGYDAKTGKFTFANEYQITSTKKLELSFSELEKSAGSWFNVVLPPESSS